jgi:hypothetical protein
MAWTITKEGNSIKVSDGVIRPLYFEINSFDVGVSGDRISLKRKNKTGSTILEGNLIYQDPNTDDGVLLTSSLGSIAVYGVVVDGDLGVDGWLTVAVSGDYNVLINGAVLRNQLVYQSALSGEAYSSSASGTGTMAITKGTRSGIGADLVKCWIHKMDTI